MSQDALNLSFALITGFAAFLAFSRPAPAQGRNCAPRASLITQLNERYGESLQNQGLTQTGRMFEMFADTQSGSWTLLISLPSGLSCIAAVGRSFERVDHPSGQGA